MVNNFPDYEAPYYYIAIPLNNSESLWDFIADARDEVGATVNHNGKIFQVKGLTVFEDDALIFRQLDKAIDWAYEHLPKLKHEIENRVPEYFNWDKASIIKKEYIVVPLGKI